MRSIEDVKALHFDRGDGTCGYCFEEMPCVGSIHGARSGIHQYEYEQEMEYWLAESLDRQTKINYINEVFRAAGIECEIQQQVNGQMIDVVVLLTIARKIDAACGLGIESRLSPEETIDEEEDDEQVPGRSA